MKFYKLQFYSIGDDGKVTFLTYKTAQSRAKALKFLGEDFEAMGKCPESFKFETPKGTTITDAVYFIDKKLKVMAILVETESDFLNSFFERGCLSSRL